MPIKDVISRLNQVFSKRLDTQGRTDAAPSIPHKARMRLWLLYRDILDGIFPGNPWHSGLAANEEFWFEVHTLLQHSKGVSVLSESVRRSGLFMDADTVRRDLFSYLMECSSVDFLDFLELSFHVSHPPEVDYDSSQFIDAVNEILEGEALPYRLTHFVKVEVPEVHFGRTSTFIETVAWPQVIESSSEVMYKEAIKPALQELAAPDFGVPNQEFLKGMRHYRDGDYGECLTAFGSAVESTLKVVCTRHGWPYGADDTLSALIENVIPKLGLDAAYKERLKVLTTPRNRLGSAHGGGTVLRQPEKHVAQFMMTTSAAAVAFLVSASDQMLGRR